MGKIILRKFKKPETSDSRVIRIGADVYDRITGISEETGLSMQRLTSILLKEALSEVVIVDEEEREETGQ